MDKSSKLKSSLYLLIILAPAFFAILWHSLNNVYPRIDGAYYLEASQNILSDYQNKGLIDALVTGYSKRHWSQNMWSAIGGFFLVLSRGNILLGVSMAMISFYVLFTVSLFLLLELFVSQLKSALLVLFITSLPVIFLSATRFYTELPFLALFTLSFYFLIRSEHWANKKSSILFGLFIGLSFCLRPAISFTLTFFPALIILKDLLKNKFENKSNFYKSLSVFSVILLAWWLPYISEFLNYAYTCTMGAISNVGNTRDLGDHSWLIKNIYSRLLGKYFLVFIFFYLIGKTVAILRPQSLEKSETEHSYLRDLKLFLPVIVFPILFGTFISNSQDLRYYLVPMVFIFVLLYIKIAESKLIFRFFAPIMSILISINILNIANSTLEPGSMSLAPLAALDGWRSYFLDDFELIKPPIKNDSSLDLAIKLSSLLENKKIIILELPHEDIFNSEFNMTLHSRALGNFHKISKNEFFGFSTPSCPLGAVESCNLDNLQIKRALAKYDYALLGPIGFPRIEPNSNNGYISEKLRNSLNTKNESAEFGLKFIKEIPIKSFINNNKSSKAILLEII